MLSFKNCIFRSCGGIIYIPKIAGGSKQSKAVPYVKQQITDTLKTMGQAKHSVQKRQTTTEEEKQKHLEHILDFTERLIKHARILEKSAVEDVNRYYKAIMDKQQSAMKSIDDAVVKMEDRLKSVDNARLNSDSQVFVDINRGQQEVKIAKQLEQRLDPTGPRKVLIQFMIEDEVDSFLRASLLGKIVEKKLYKAALHGQYDVGIKGENNSTAICDICELSDGKILMTDWTNKCIKQFDLKTYKTSKSLKTPSEPWGITQTSQDEVAVTTTVERKVQFVKVKDKWKLTRSFKVKDCCRGIFCNKSEIFVSCGGHPGGGGFAPEGPGFVGVYDMLGSLIHTIQYDRGGLQIFSVPYHIVTADRGNKLHIVDKKGGVITVNRDGKVLWTFCKKIKWARCLCAVAEDSLVVGGKHSDNVIQIGTDGNVVGDLIDWTVGIEKPISVSFSRISSRLIMAFANSSQIKIFNLST